MAAFRIGPCHEICRRSHCHAEVIVYVVARHVVIEFLVLHVDAQSHREVHVAHKEVVENRLVEHSKVRNRRAVVSGKHHRGVGKFHVHLDSHRLLRKRVGERGFGQV